MICGKKGKTLKCEKLVYHEYKKLYDIVASLIHWNLCEKHGTEKKENWHEQAPKGMTENHDIKIFRKYNIKCDNVKEEQMLYWLIKVKGAT